MTLYEIDAGIMSCIDAETGEIIDEEKLNELQLTRESKIENVAPWIKELKAEAAAIKAEKDAFAEREKAAKSKIDGLEHWLSFALAGEKFATPKVAISFRRSESVEILDEGMIPKKYLNKKITYTVNRMAIKDAIKSGLNVKGATLSENQNLQVK